MSMVDADQHATPPEGRLPLRLILVCDWIPPKTNSDGQYMHARGLAEAQNGRQATLIGLGEVPREQSTTQSLDGGGSLTTVWVPAAETPRASLFARGLWTLTILLRLAMALHRQQKAGPCEIVVVGSPPFFSYLCILLNRLVWRRRLTYRIMDFYPEVIFAAGKMRFLTWIAPLFWALRRQADSIEALGEDQKRRLVQGGLDANRIGVHRLGSPIHIPQDAQPAPRPFAHTDFVLLYSGNLGVAHEIETLCEAYRRHVVEGSNRVRLWVNGRGARLGELEAYCRKHNLPLALTPPAPLSQLPNLLKAADAHLVLLHAHFWGLVHPSKVYACIDAGQPILYVGPREADAAQLIMQNAGSAQIDPGDVDACFWTLESFAEEQEAKTPRRCAAVQGAPLGSQAPFVEVRSFSDYQADEVGE